MSTRERILTIRLLDKLGRYPECAELLGVERTEPESSAAHGTKPEAVSKTQQTF